MWKQRGILLGIAVILAFTIAYFVANQSSSGNFPTEKQLGPGAFTWKDGEQSKTFEGKFKISFSAQESGSTIAVEAGGELIGDQILCAQISDLNDAESTLKLFRLVGPVPAGFPYQEGDRVYFDCKIDLKAKKKYTCLLERHVQ